MLILSLSLSSLSSLPSNQGTRLLMMTPRKFQLFKLFVYILLGHNIQQTCLRSTYALQQKSPSVLDKDARTIIYINKPPNARGEFHFEFQTSNGITTKSAGNEHGFSGVVQFITIEGMPITMTYTADADGYHPSGDHIPMVPAHVLKALEYIRTHPQVNEKESRKLR